MIATTQNGRSRKNLADQIDRLDHLLDGLAEGLNDAVASVVQQVVGQAVHEAVAAVLTEVMTNPELDGWWDDQGREYLDSAWWISVFPGVVLMLTSLVVSRTGDWLRDWLPGLDL